MKRIYLTTALLLALGASRVFAADPPPAVDIGPATVTYFTNLFEQLRLVAEQKPTVDTLRTAMRPLVKNTDGFFGGTLIDTNFVIRQVYNPRDFLARGFDLKKVKQLDHFWALMHVTPTPQISEPGHGSIVQPRLIAMRYPVIVDGQLQSIVSIMIRAEAYLEAVGLDKMKGYRITCRGTLAEEDGDLKGELKSATVQLPANEWLIEYKP